MVSFKTGFGRADITPPKYHALAGFGNDTRRICNNILDRPMLTCVALSDDAGAVWLIYSSDTLYVHEKMVEWVRKAVQEQLDIPGSNVLMVATHTHAGPSVYAGEMNETGFYPTYVAAAVKAAGEALADLAETTISVGQKQIDRMVFVRHYVLDDGTFIGMGAGHPGRTRFHTDISDDQMQLIRFHREDARDILLVNWQCHATFTSGEVRADMSADFIAPLRNHLEGLSGCKVIYLQGAAGNLVSSSRIEEENILPRGDYVAYGRALAEHAFSLLDSLESVQCGALLGKQMCHKAKVDHSDDPLAEQASATYDAYYALSDPAERRQLIKESPFNSVYHAMHVRGRSRMPETLDMELNALCAGDIAFATAPFEMFNSNGRFVKENSPFKMTFMLAYCNGFNSYLPDEKAFNYDCYEVNARRFPKGAAEEVADIDVDMLKKLKEEQQHV